MREDGERARSEEEGGTLNGLGTIWRPLDEAELPLVRWIEEHRGDDRVQAAAREQTGALLRPYLAALLSRPRELLPMSSASPVPATKEAACGED